MEVALPARPSMPAPGLPVAVILHAGLLAWLAAFAVQSFDLAPVTEQSIEVELQTPEEFEALTRPRRPPIVAIPAPGAPGRPDPHPHPPPPAAAVGGPPRPARPGAPGRSPEAG